MAFGSNAIVGTCSNNAAAIPGPEAYPPTPNTTSRLEFADQPPAREQTARNIEHCTHPSRQRDILQRTHLDQPQSKAGSGNQSRFHSARRADKQHIGLMPCNELMGNGQRWNDMTACATTGNEDAQRTRTWQVG